MAEMKQTCRGRSEAATIAKGRKLQISNSKLPGPSAFVRGEKRFKKLYLFFRAQVFIHILDDAVEILAALFEDFFNFRRSPPLLLAFLALFENQAEMAGAVGLDQGLFEHALKDWQCPFFIFAIAPFAARAAADFSGRDKLPRP